MKIFPYMDNQSIKPESIYLLIFLYEKKEIGAVIFLSFYHARKEFNKITASFVKYYI